MSLKKIILPLSLFALVGALVLFFNKPAEEKIPELLPKNQLIGSMEEQNKTLDIYGNQLIALEKNPDDFNARLLLAQVYMNEARLTGEHGHYYPAALQMLESILDRAPEDKTILFQTLSMKATALMSQHQFKEALETGQRAVALNPHNAGIYGVLVDANVELGQYGEAVKYSDKMISIRPDLRSYSRISYLREIHGEVAGSIEAMKMAVSAGFTGMEEKAWTRLTLGQLYENYGDLANAEVQYRLSLEERPEYPFALAALAGLEIRKENFSEAEALLDKATKIIPEVAFYEQLIDVYAKTGRTELAKTTLATVFEMMEEDVATGHEMALEFASVHLNYSGDYASALTYAQKEYSVRPENVDVNEMMASIYFKLNDYPNAKKHLQAALKTNSQDPALVSLAGLIKIKTGQENQGEALISSSFEINPYQSHALAAEARTAIGAVKI